MSEQRERFRIEPVAARHERQSFHCGHPFLDTYLAQFARQNSERGIARAWVMVPARAGNPVVGYYTLSAGAIAFEHVTPALRKRLPRYPLPVVRIGELAVDLAWQGRGLGSVLLVDAMQRIVTAASDVAVWAIVVDPIDTPAATFYRHFGFEPLLDSDSLLLTIKDAVTWLG